MPSALTCIKGGRPPHSAILLLLALLTFNFSYRGLLLVQPDGLGDGSLRQGVKPFRENKHSKGRLVGGTEKIERVLRVLPTGYDDFTVVVDLRRREDDDLCVRPGCSPVLCRNSFDHVLIGQPFRPVALQLGILSKRPAARLDSSLFAAPPPNQHRIRTLPYVALAGTVADILGDRRVGSLSLQGEACHGSERCERTTGLPGQCRNNFSRDRPTRELMRAGDHPVPRQMPVIPSCPRAALRVHSRLVLAPRTRHDQRTRPWLTLARTQSRQSGRDC